LAIWVGVPVKEFSFGNTMILAGVVAICGGLILIGLALVVRELRKIARRLEPMESTMAQRDLADLPLPAGSIAGAAQRGRDVGLPPPRRPPAREERDVAMPPAPAPPPWREDAAAQDRIRSDAAHPPLPETSAPAVPVQAPPEPPAKVRRNLFFSSSRRDRETTARSEPAVSASVPKPPTEVTGTPSPHPSFTNAWPRTERERSPAETLQRRPAAPAPLSQAEPEAPNLPSSAVTVVKSGVVDGMAYSLYSDGSIEAQMPEGMMRFASIDELRKHLDQRA
jgi:hypothetical protein